jgi:hypothetical protein
MQSIDEVSTNVARGEESILDEIFDLHGSIKKLVASQEMKLVVSQEATHKNSERTRNLLNSSVTWDTSCLAFSWIRADSSGAREQGGGVSGSPVSRRIKSESSFSVSNRFRFLRGFGAGTGSGRSGLNISNSIRAQTSTGPSR